MNNDLEDQLNRAREYAGEKAVAASGQIKELGTKARENAAVAYDASREKAEEIAGEIKVRSAKVIQENPLAVVAGGLALGALIAVLLPKTKRRAGAVSTLAASLLAARGMGASASDGIARTAGKIKANVKTRLDDLDTSAARAKLSELSDIRKAKAKLGELIDTDAAKEKVGEFIEKASEAVSSAGKSAAESLRRK